MQINEQVFLKRDCDGYLVPAGTKITLRQGAEARITQALGGSYTVVVDGNMFRIEGKDADALGKAVETAKVGGPSANGTVDAKLIWDQLHTCYDPEIPVDIVDLGLIYDLEITALPGGGNRVDVKMTLTAPGCGMGEILRSDVQSKVMNVEGVTEANVEMVFDPPWNQEMLSDAAKLKLGLM